MEHTKQQQLEQTTQKILQRLRNGNFPVNKPHINIDRRLMP